MKDEEMEVRMFSLRLTNAARENAERIIRAGWTTTLTGAVHYALALAAKESTVEDSSSE